MNWKKIRKENNNLPPLTTKTFLNTDWITNFWLIDNKVYFTDADLLNTFSSVVSIELENLKMSLVFSANNTNAKFLSHPDPIKSSILESSKTDLLFECQFEGYLYSLLKFDEVIYGSLIKNGDLGGVYNLKTKENIYDGIVLLGKMKEQLLAKKIINKEPVLIKNKIYYEPVKEDIRKIIKLAEADVCLTNKNEILIDGHKVFKGESEINIATYNQESILVSDKQNKTLILLSGKDLKKRQVIWTGNYFSQLLAIDGEVIIGKPIFDNENYINYCLPPIFIY